ncbi:MAG: hypothetical protein ABI164_05700 [Acidobacteriaceae bacterium]
MNKVPLTDGPSFWTAHNFGTAIAPYKVFNRSEFISYFEDRNYVMQDNWDVFDMSVDIPFHSKACVPRFSGFYLVHKDALDDGSTPEPHQVPPGRMLHEN